MIEFVSKMCLIEIELIDLKVFDVRSVKKLYLNFYTDSLQNFLVKLDQIQERIYFKNAIAFKTI